MITHGLATGNVALLRRAADGLARTRDERSGPALGWVRLRVAILHALLADGLGDPDAAMRTLRIAIAEAAPEGVVAPFIDAGPPMRTLLLRLRAQAGTAGAGYVDVLLAAVAGTPPAPQPPAARPTRGLIEPLTHRELDVLRLLAAGRSNAGMARALVVEQSTIKTHLVHLYGKLGVHSRTQAVARAHALRLLERPGS